MRRFAGMKEDFRFSMLTTSDVLLIKTRVASEKAIEEIKVAASCFRPEHGPKVEALNCRFGTSVSIPDRPPMVHLEKGANIILIECAFGRKLKEGEVYTPEEIQKAYFSFTRLEVDGPEQLLAKRNTSDLEALKKRINEVLEARQAAIEEVTAPVLHKIALEAGVQDKSYSTTRWGEVSSYSGTAEFEAGGRRWKAIGHRPVGTASWVDESGYIEYISLD